MGWVILNQPTFFCTAHKFIPTMSRAIVLSYPAAKRYRAAYMAANYAWRNRRNIYRAGKRIQRAWRRYRSKKRSRFSTRNVGEPIGSVGAKKFNCVDNTTGTFATRTLHTTNLTAIPPATSNTDNRDSRERTIVNLRGFKLCMHVRNAQNNQVLLLNLAILAPKVTSAAVGTSDFFRGVGNTRSLDFNPTNLSALDFHCRPVNTDLYTILWHKRIKINPATDSATIQLASKASFVALHKYIKVKRQLRFEDISNTNGPVDGNIFFVHWADNALNTTGAAPVSSAYNMHQWFLTYFREPK